MTPEEAIKTVHCCMHIGDDIILQARDMAIIALEFKQQFDKLGLTIEEIKELQEKQIPKKVNKSYGTKVKAADLDDGKVLTFSCYPCPNCGCWLHDNPSKKYCRKCGQALDWSQRRYHYD